MTELITAAVSDFVRVIVTAVVLGAEDFAHFCGRDFTGEVALGRVPRKGIGCALRACQLRLETRVDRD